MGLDVPQCYSTAAGIIRCKRRWLEGGGVEVEDSAGDYVFLNGDERFYFFFSLFVFSFVLVLVEMDGLEMALRDY